MKERKINMTIQTDKEVLEKVKDVMKQISRGKKVKKTETLVFDSILQFRKIMTPEKLRLLKLIHECRPKSVYVLAKIAKRDYGNVHRDLDALKRFGLIETENHEFAVDYGRIAINLNL